MDMLASSVYGTGGVERLYRFNYYSNSALRADFIDKINDGAFVVNYIGNAMWYYWDIGYFTMNDIGELQNDNKLPFIYNAAPEVGNFTDSYHCTPPCFAEKWLTARNSVTGAATGAIGVYGSSIMIHPPLLELISASLYFNSMLTTWTSNTRHFGVLCYLSAINMRNQFGSAANHVLLTLNYFGDPSLKVIPNEYVAPPVD